MTEKIKTITSNGILDDIFINCPLWFPIIYIFIAINFPSGGKLLFILSLFLFAETHFASTWVFFFDKENWGWLKKNNYKLVFLPLYLALIAIFAWYFSPSLIIILHYLASGWHVTKQSIGILKINKLTQKYFSFLIYLVSFLCLFVGLSNPGILSTSLSVFEINILLIFCSIVYAWVLFSDKAFGPFKYLESLMPVFTGTLIYVPLLFFKNLAVATAVGVGMHWCQYIAIMWSTSLRKSQKKSNNKLISSNTIKSCGPKIIYVFIYSLIMTSCAIYGMPDLKAENPEYSLIYLFPLLFQFYHFYIDGFIWKFSDPHIKGSVMSYLFSNAK